MAYIYALILSDGGGEVGRLGGAGEGDDVADVLHTGDEEDETLET